MKLSEKTIQVVGLGQMGSSLAKAIKERGLARSVIGFTRFKETAQRALQQKIVDSVFTDARRIFDPKADIVILATPVHVIVDLVRRIPPGLSRTLFMDTGSVKSEILAAVNAKRPRLNFISAHPMTGTEKSGIDACNPDLFEGKPFILINGKGLNREMAQWGEALAKGIGAHPIRMRNAEEHDRAVAILSHLPHVLAYTLVHLADEIAEIKGARAGFLWKLAGPSFRDATRVASSNAETTFDFLWGNRMFLLEALKSFRNDLAQSEALLKRRDGNAFRAWMREAHRKRERNKKNIPG